PVRISIGSSCIWWWGSARCGSRIDDDLITRDMVWHMKRHQSAAYPARESLQPSPQRGKRLALLALVALLLVLVMPAVAVRADAAPPFLAAPGGPWQPPEVTLKQHFAFTYIQREPVAAQVDTYKKMADAVYDMETDIFGTMLPQPVPVYLFNDMTQFT